MNYNEFAEQFYLENVSSLKKAGFQRTLKSFHLVDMYPSLKMMNKFSNTKEMTEFIKKSYQIENQVSIYIHFPFCKNLCSYCHIYKENLHKNEHLETSYINTLKTEIETYAKLFNKKIAVRSIYFGGGTPSLMHINELRKILKTLKSLFNISNKTFISFEVYPDVNFDKHRLFKKLRLLKSFGVQEIVLDMQSTNPKSLKEVGRGNTSFFAWKEVIGIIKKADIPRIKTSIIIGLPLDTIETLKKSIFDIINTKEVSTVSLFLMEFRKGLRIYDELNNNSFKFCNSEDRDKMHIMARKILSNNGFYESPLHFFNRKRYKKNRINKKALIGTDEDHLLGFGPSAYGHIVIGNKSIKYYNHADIHKYIHKIRNQELPISRWYKLDKEDRVFSKLINDISSGEIINKDEMLRKYNYNIDKKFKNILNGFEKLKLIKSIGNKVFITESGKLRAEEMLWYLYNKKYKILERKTSKDKEIIMHNYVTVISVKNEKLFSNFINPR